MPLWLEHQIVTFLSRLFESIGWGGVVGIMALESANIPIPSEVTMPLSGWLLVQARGGTGLQAFLLGGLWGAVGCTVGSVLSYALGAYGGRALLDRYGKYLMIGHHDLVVADRPRDLRALRADRELGRELGPREVRAARREFISAEPCA